MERQPRFDLTTATEAWLDQLRQRGTLTDDDVQELHTHVLDSIEPLKATGLSEEEAFWVARHRLGSAEVVSAEFGKIQRPFAVRREPVVFLLGALVFVILKNGMDAAGYGVTAWLARHSANDQLVIGVDFGFRLLLFLVLVAGLIGYFRRGEAGHRWFFGWLHRAPVGVVLTLTVLVGGVQFAWFFNKKEVMNLVRDSSRELYGIWFNNRLYAYGFYLSWLVALLTLSVRHVSVGKWSLAGWVQQAHAVPLILLGFGFFSGAFLGIGFDVVQRFTGVSNELIGPASSLLFCLVAGFVLAKNKRYSFAVRVVVAVAPILLWCSLGFILGDKPYETEMHFLLKNGSLAVVGALIGLGLGAMQQQKSLTA